MRYDEETGIYRDCRFCGGKGCMACPGEADRAYKREYPDGPQPIDTFKLDNPEDMERLRNQFGIEAMEKAFGPDGGGLEELLEANPYIAAGVGIELRPNPFIT